VGITVERVRYLALEISAQFPPEIVKKQTEALPQVKTLKTVRTKNMSGHLL